MLVYQSTGNFDSVKKSFNLNVQTTDIGKDEFYISAYYNICSPTRFAIVAILQTKDGNATNFSHYPPDNNLLENDISFSVLDTSYCTPSDKKISDITKNDKIIVYVHHGIGFDPTTNADDNKYIENYKAGIYVYLANGSPPGAKGDGGLNG
ncbi:hypothetical protein [Flavobacterium sp.]|uniref:hypothetical protein n=1 Tax=Flavobacterium sp. TaxID=239 RepID=UPI002FDEFA4B